MYYTTINEICANKPNRLRRSEAMGGNGDKQTTTSLKNRQLVVISTLLLLVAQNAFRPVPFDKI